MSILTVGLILAMLLWSVGFAVAGLVPVEEVLWRRPAGQAGPPVSRMRKIGTMGLLAIGRILVVTALVAGVLMAEREAHVVHLESRFSDLEHRLGQEGAGPPAPARRIALSRAAARVTRTAGHPASCERRDLVFALAPKDQNRKASGNPCGIGWE